MFLHTLDNTSWSIADIIGPIGTGTHNFLINFTANETEYASIHFVGDANSGHVYYDDTLVASYPRTVWEDAVYQQITIAGGIDATNPTLLAWFKQYAKNATPSGGDVDIIGALNDIAEAISGGGSGGGLPDPSAASAGDVLSLDEAKKPAWAAPSGGAAVSGAEWDPGIGWGNLYYVESNGIKYLPCGAYGKNGVVTGIRAVSCEYDDNDLPIESSFTIEDYSLPVLEDFRADYYKEIDLTNNSKTATTIFGVSAIASYDGTTKYFYDRPLTTLKVSTANFDTILSGGSIQNQNLVYIGGDSLKQKGAVITDGTRRLRLNNVDGEGDNYGYIHNLNGVYADASNFYFIECYVNYQTYTWTFTTHSFQSNNASVDS